MCEAYKTLSEKNVKIHTVKTDCLAIHEDDEDKGYGYQFCRIWGEGLLKCGSDIGEFGDLRMEEKDHSVQYVKKPSHHWWRVSRNGEELHRRVFPANGQECAIRSVNQPTCTKKRMWKQQPITSFSTLLFMKMWEKVASFGLLPF